MTPVAYLLDTNVVSEWVRRRPDPSVVRWLDEADEDEVHLSVIVAGRVGRSLPVADAPTAAHHGLAIVSRNVSDLGGLGVEVIDPWSGG
ncbi:MAG: hypothetical protein L0H64_15100 [Pseudonocardia sp.]|nr:hypothetical protein [Pseudonocardia sp.]